MAASNDSTRERITDALGAPDGAVSFAWDVVKRHPIASLGAVAAGVGAYVLLTHLEGDKRSAGSRSDGDARPARGGRSSGRGARASRSSGRGGAGRASGAATRSTSARSARGARE
jgi:hypothetical protein